MQKTPTPNTEKGKELLALLEQLSVDMVKLFSENLWLNEKTTTVSEFGDKLVGNGLLDITTKRRIMEDKKIEEDQSREIYWQVAKRGNWKGLINAWEGSNSHIVERLTKLLEQRQKEEVQYSNDNPEIDNTTEITPFADSWDNKVPVEDRNGNPEKGNNAEYIALNIYERQSMNSEDSPQVTPEEDNLRQSNSFIVMCQRIIRGLKPEFICILILLTIILVGASVLLVHYLRHSQSKSSSTAQTNGKNVSSFVRGNNDGGIDVPFGNNAEFDSTAEGVTTGKGIPFIRADGGDYFGIGNRTSASTEIANVTHRDSSMIKFLDSIKILEINDPLNISVATNSKNRFYQLIARNYSHNLDSLNTSIPGTVRSVEFKGSINHQNVTAIIEAFRHSLAKITFLFGNMLCSEFAHFKIPLNSSKVEVPLLHEMEFAGNDNCFHVFQFVVSTLSFQNVRGLKFVGNHIMPDIVNSFKEILRVSQNTLEYLILDGVSFCNNCHPFENLHFPNMKHATSVFGQGGNAPQSQDTIIEFNKMFPDNCRFWYPDEKSGFQPDYKEPHKCFDEATRSTRVAQRLCGSAGIIFPDVLLRIHVNPHALGPSSSPE